ncbi:GNAT family N-acetyltransferase [Dyadobacter fermentans]|uniref:GCN5-related N-acetyltransferase n=1 Tax=Dyadobacter fermentans (strain ATCC 700827 / DSM 18053 / CIP 107007 / KCTC 52180 / NS114) TaxID=471854 RepID=C6VUX3_DYAFD|nr:GNAT family N-acetyltransferase [Dyadobacter fermentans]ACT93110.1 GCN5-related N-acetyltransferase [Dyadobacter fermentans DSM 18053]
MSTINIRPAHLEDKIALQMLYKRTIDYACTNDYDQQQRDAWKRGTENESRWDQAISEQFFVIAEMDREIVGFGSLKNGCYIDFMYTDSRHLRKGIGLAIYKQLEAQAIDRGTQVLTADVSKTARPFFEKQGFSIIRENHNLIRGVLITNYHMQKKSIGDAGFPTSR